MEFVRLHYRFSLCYSRPVDFSHFKLFRDIAQTRSVSRAAALNKMSQSAASQHVQELEARFGVELLDRSHRPVSLTAAGRLYYEFCREVLRLKAQFDASLEQLKGQAEGVVRVAAIYSVGISEMAELRAEFARRCPQATIEVEYLRPEKVYEAVLGGHVDLGLVSYPAPSRGLAVRPWRQETMVVAAAPQHWLASRNSLRPADLEGLDFVGFDEDLPIRRHIDQFLKEQGVQVKVVMHFDNIPAVKEALLLGTVASILPERILREEVRQGRLVAIPLEPAPVRPLGIIHLRRKKFTPAARCLLELLEERSAAS